MFYTGFADEAANSLERQLEATKAGSAKGVEVIDRAQNSESPGRTQYNESPKYK